MESKEDHKVGKQLERVRYMSRAPKAGEPRERESVTDSKMLGVGVVTESTGKRSVGDEKT